MSASRLFSLPKVLNSTEDAHMESMGTFQADEHLQAPTPSERGSSLAGGTLALESIRMMWED
jgi:hypothetical protein